MEKPHSGSYSVRRSISAYFCDLLHVTLEIKFQKPKNNYVLCTRPLDVLRDDDPIRFETSRSFSVLM
jgi:hypothetical protein